MPVSQGARTWPCVRLPPKADIDRRDGNASSAVRQRWHERVYGAHVNRICASTLAWICDLLTRPKTLESKLLPRLSPATKYIPSGITTCFKSLHSRHAIVGSVSLTFSPAGVVTKILHTPYRTWSPGTATILFTYCVS